MAVELTKLLPSFGGLADFVHCFNHQIALVAQRVLRPFKAQNTTADDAGSEALDATMHELAAGLGVDDLEELDDEEDGEGDNLFDVEDVDAWVDAVEELSEAEKVELKQALQPIKDLLMKVRMGAPLKSFPHADSSSLSSASSPWP